MISEILFFILIWLHQAAEYLWQTNKALAPCDLGLLTLSLDKDVAILDIVIALWIRVPVLPTDMVTRFQ